MPVNTINLGKYQDIPFAEFGTGDILITKARLEEDQYSSMLIFSNHDSVEIGDETNEWDGKDTNQLPNVAMVLRFTKPESITALIHSLAELQKEVFKTYKN